MALCVEEEVVRVMRGMYVDSQFDLREEAKEGRGERDGLYLLKVDEL